MESIIARDSSDRNCMFSYESGRSMEAILLERGPQEEEKVLRRGREQQETSKWEETK